MELSGVGGGEGGKGERKRDASADRAIISAGGKPKTGLGWIGLVRANIRPGRLFCM